MAGYKSVATGGSKKTSRHWAAFGPKDQVAGKNKARQHILLQKAAKKNAGSAYLLNHGTPGGGGHKAPSTVDHKSSLSGTPRRITSANTSKVSKTGGYRTQYIERKVSAEGDRRTAPDKDHKLLSAGHPMPMSIQGRRGISSGRDYSNQSARQSRTASRHPRTATATETRPQQQTNPPKSQPTSELKAKMWLNYESKLQSSNDEKYPRIRGNEHRGSSRSEVESFSSAEGRNSALQGFEGKNKVRQPGHRKISRSSDRRSKGVFENEGRFQSSFVVLQRRAGSGPKDKSNSYCEAPQTVNSGPTKSRIGNPASRGGTRSSRMDVQPEKHANNFEAKTISRQEKAMTLSKPVVSSSSPILPRGQGKKFVIDEAMMNRSSKFGDGSARLAAIKDKYRNKLINILDELMSESFYEATPQSPTKEVNGRYRRRM